MKATITSIELKGPIKFFSLSIQALHIIRQLKKTQCKSYKSKGFWTKHYTMSLWNSEEEMKSFATNGAHLQAMKSSAEIAKEIRTITVDCENLPSWKEAKAMLQKGKVIRFD